MSAATWEPVARQARRTLRALGSVRPGVSPREASALTGSCPPFHPPICLTSSCTPVLLVALSVCACGACCPWTRQKRPARRGEATGLRDGRFSLWSAEGSDGLGCQQLALGVWLTNPSSQQPVGRGPPTPCVWGEPAPSPGHRVGPCAELRQWSVCGQLRGRGLPVFHAALLA